MASMASKNKASTSQKNETSIIDQKSMVMDGKVYNISDVKNGITSGFNNSSGLKAVEPELLNFTQLGNSIDSFSLKDCVLTSNFKIDVAYKCITNSLAMNNAKKANKIQKVKLSDVTYFIVPKVKPGAIKNVVSYNRFMAICIAAIRVNITKNIYSWEKNEYVEVRVENHSVPEGVGNKLALACGFGEDHDLYWFYASGFEFTFEFYPIEVICCVLMRIENAESFKLDKMDELDLVKNLASQIAKKGSPEQVIADLGTENIKKKYNEYNNERTDQLGIRRAKDTLDLLKDMLKKF
uniref:Nucleocapsid protein n=1 Tax=Jujube yellow mottle-associated virus TaxID=2595002 RepID=A0A7T4WRT2_9VIRU|nr:nucleocapsid protein [Jujube yellow mottle-associated virus]